MTSIFRSSCCLFNDAARNSGCIASNEWMNGWMIVNWKGGGPIYWPDNLMLKKSRDSAVGIATGYGLDDRGVGVRVPVKCVINTVTFQPILYFQWPFFVVCFTALSVSLATQRRMVEWLVIMNWKLFERKRPWLNPGIIPIFAWKD
jgi:hypothetical protein